MAQPGTRVADRFDLLRVEPGGPLYRAYSALELGAAREVVLWIPHAGLLVSPESRARFVDAARATRTADGAHLVRVLDAGVDPFLGAEAAAAASGIGATRGGVWVALAPASGQTLAERIARGRPAPDPVVAYLAQSLARAIDGAHAVGLVHGYLRAADVVMAGEWPRLAGVGLWSAVDRLPALAALRADVHLLAPEVRTGDVPSRRADIYGMAVILAEVALGQAAESGAEAAVLRDRLRRERPRLEAALRPAFAASPAERPASASQLAADLFAIMPPTRARRPTIGVDGQVQALAPTPDPPSPWSTAHGSTPPPTPRGAAAARPGATPRSMPGAPPGALPRSMPGALPRSMPGAPPRSMPGAPPRSMPGATPRSMPKGTPAPPPSSSAPPPAAAVRVTPRGAPVGARPAPVGARPAPGPPASDHATAGAATSSYAERPFDDSSDYATVPIDFVTPLPMPLPRPPSPIAPVLPPEPAPFVAFPEAASPLPHALAAPLEPAPGSPPQLVSFRHLTPEPRTLPLAPPALARSSREVAAVESAPADAAHAAAADAAHAAAADAADAAAAADAAHAAADDDFAYVVDIGVPEDIEDAPTPAMRDRTPLPLPAPVEASGPTPAPITLLRPDQAPTPLRIEASKALPTRPHATAQVSVGSSFAERALLARRQRTRGLALLLLILAGGAGFWYWRTHTTAPAVVVRGAGAGAPAAPPAPRPPAVVAAAAPTGPCPADMLLVDGKRRFCIDRDEAHAADRVPLTGVTHERAAAACTAQQKRLCEAREWELACRGDRRASYPWGARPTRQPICNLGPGRPIAKVGSFEACVSASGARDMSGNVAEWVAEGQLRGGSAATPGDGRCSRPLPGTSERTLDDVGYRCCADANL